VRLLNFSVFLGGMKNALRIRAHTHALCPVYITGLLLINIIIIIAYGFLREGEDRENNEGTL
jgi:hypothetical protein